MQAHPIIFFVCVSAGERGPPGLMVGILLKFLFFIVQINSIQNISQSETLKTCLTFLLSFSQLVFLFFFLFFPFFFCFFFFFHKLNSNNSIIGMFLSFPDARERSLGWRRKESTSCWLVKSRDLGSIFSLISASEIQFETAKRAPHSCSE